MGPGGSCRHQYHQQQHQLNNESPDQRHHLHHEFEIVAYKTTPWRKVLYYILSFGTCGLFWLFLHWNPKKLISFCAKRCSVGVADLVLVIDNHGREEICVLFNRRRVESSDVTLVANVDGGLVELEEVRWFSYRKLQYTWIDGEWTTASRAYSSVSPDHLEKSTHPGGLSEEEVALRRAYFGPNVMNAELTPFHQIIVKEVLTPFYLFQAFSVIVWYIDDYIWYSTLIILMTSYSIILTLQQTRQQEKRIRSMVVEHDQVQVIRDDGIIRKVDSCELVPGDILIIPPQGCVLYADCVLLTGSLIVNESMLTGESIPITKSAIVDDGNEKTFSIEKHAKHVIFNGTRVLQTKYYRGQHVKALVIRTAYSTTKGQLVRSIMYPKPADFKFITELMKFVGVLSIVAILGFIYTSVILVYRGSPLWRVIIRALDLVTITVPPALPAVMSIGIFYAQRRLREQSIYCISPTTINTCGAIDVVCFDKTGTLTADGLDFHAVRVVNENGGKVALGEDVVRIVDDDQCREMVRAIATCHSLTKINNEMHGDPLDVILFEQTGFSLGEEEDAEDQCGNIQPILVKPGVQNLHQTDCLIIKQFNFSSALQRMSVIVKDAANCTLMAYCKGSPEMIASLCSAATIPANFHDVVEEYTQHGYRLIAVAEKRVELTSEQVQRAARHTIECDLVLLGLVALENRLKPATSDVIAKLNRANIRSVMVTGDNLLTALSVARECGIIREGKTFLIEHEQGVIDKHGRTRITIRESYDLRNGLHLNGRSSPKCGDLSKLTNKDYQFAISGATFLVITHEYPELLDQLSLVCNVFARMLPEQKQVLVEHLQTVGQTVAMCGDGANDCAALKAAHAGISLSDAEASIAAPFTSKLADIRCVLTLIGEGRAALVTSFSAFLCMAGYSLTQFISILLLYWISTSYSQMQFLFIDMPIVTCLAWVSSRTCAYTSLAPRPPPATILSVTSMVSLFGQLAIGAIAQVFVFCWIGMQPWFVGYRGSGDEGEEDRRSMQGTAIFYVSVFHYIMLYTVFAKGPPYRARITSNRPFTFALCVVTAVCLFLILSKFSVVHQFLGCVEIPLEFRLWILFTAILTGIISLVFDHFLETISNVINDKLHQRLKENK